MQRRIPFEGLLEPSVYLPLTQIALWNPAVALRTGGEPTALAPEVRAAIRAIDPDQPITLVRSMDAHIEYELAAISFIALFVGALGLLAIFLSAMGIYGVMAHGVVQERREIGIRMAMGARAGRLVGMVTRRGLTLAGIGMLLGAPLAYLTHWAVMDALDLFDVELGGNVALTATSVLVGVAVLASFLPARAAARVHPTRVLSVE
jgi:ABC-type antimicrobial peptide transport system permease subunit